MEAKEKKRKMEQKSQKKIKITAPKDNQKIYSNILRIEGVVQQHGIKRVCIRIGGDVEEWEVDGSDGRFVGYIRLPDCKYNTKVDINIHTGSIENISRNTMALKFEVKKGNPEEMMNEWKKRLKIVYITTRDQGKSIIHSPKHERREKLFRKIAMNIQIMQTLIGRLSGSIPVFEEVAFQLRRRKTKPKIQHSNFSLPTLNRTSQELEPITDDEEQIMDRNKENIIHNCKLEMSRKELHRILSKCSDEELQHFIKKEIEPKVGESNYYLLINGATKRTKNDMQRITLKAAVMPSTGLYTWPETIQDLQEALCSNKIAGSKYACGDIPNGILYAQTFNDYMNGLLRICGFQNFPESMDILATKMKPLPSLDTPYLIRIENRDHKKKRKKKHYGKWVHDSGFYQRGRNENGQIIWNQYHLNGEKAVETFIELKIKHKYVKMKVKNHFLVLNRSGARFFGAGSTEKGRLLYHGKWDKTSKLSSKDIKQSKSNQKQVSEPIKPVRKRRKIERIENLDDMDLDGIVADDIDDFLEEFDAEEAVKREMKNHADSVDEASSFDMGSNFDEDFVNGGGYDSSDDDEEEEDEDNDDDEDDEEDDEEEEQTMNKLRELQQETKRILEEEECDFNGGGSG